MRPGVTPLPDNAPIVAWLARAATLYKVTAHRRICGGGCSGRCDSGCGGGCGGVCGGGFIAVAPALCLLWCLCLISN